MKLSVPEKQKIGGKYCKSMIVIMEITIFAVRHFPWQTMWKRHRMSHLAQDFHC